MKAGSHCISKKQRETEKPFLRTGCNAGWVATAKLVACSHDLEVLASHFLLLALIILLPDLSLPPPPVPIEKPPVEA